MPKVRQLGRPGGVHKIKHTGDFHYLEEVPPPPGHFRGMEVDAWNNVCQLLIDRGDLTEADLGSVEVYVQSLCDYHTLSEQVKDEGMVIVNVQGNKVKHPAADLRRNADFVRDAASGHMNLGQFHEGLKKLAQIMMDKRAQLAEEFSR